MMKPTPGALFKIDGRRFLDSQAIFNFSAAPHHHVEHTPEGYRLTSAAGSCRCCRVEGRPALSQQLGALYEIAVEEGTSMKALRKAWVDAGLIEVHDAAGAWTPPAAPVCGSSCGAACACGPCKKAHAHEPGGST